jgi:hypothetical protein
MWDREDACYRDPDTGLPLPTWRQALDRLDENDHAQSAHAMRFGS